MKAATEVQNIISLEQVEKYRKNFKERIILLGLKGTHFPQNFLQYLYPNVTAGFNDKINFPQCNFKIGVMAFIVNK